MQERGRVWARRNDKSGKLQQACTTATYLIEEIGDLLRLHKLLGLQLLRLVLSLLLRQALDVRLNVMQAHIHVGNDLLLIRMWGRVSGKGTHGTLESGIVIYLVLFKVHLVQVRCLLLLETRVRPFRLEARIGRYVLWGNPNTITDHIPRHHIPVHPPTPPTLY